LIYFLSLVVYKRVFLKLPNKGMYRFRQGSCSRWSYSYAMR